MASVFRFPWEGVWGKNRFVKALMEFTGIVLLVSGLLRVSSAAAERAWWGADVEAALEKAGTNRVEMVRALEEAPENQREGMVFLLANMPARDLEKLSADYLLRNTALAYEALETAPWGGSIPKEIFLNEILPYANIDETREDWRARLREIALPLVAGCTTAAEAAQRLNERLFAKVNVRYSTQRRKASQSPFESIETGLASCTGLTILLVDACRSVGVPARLVGIPNWVDKRGNHTWIEIWDQEWHFAGAAEPDPNGLDRGWFTHDASLAIKDSREHAIYAASFRRTGLRFPMVWSRGRDYVSAVNVTDRYTPKSAPKETSTTRLMVKVMEYPGGPRVPARVVVIEAEDGGRRFEGTSKDERFDTNDILYFHVEKGREFEIRADWEGRSVRKKHRTRNGGLEIVALFLSERAPESAASRIAACTFPRRGIAELASADREKLERAVGKYFAASAEERAEWKFDAALDRLIEEKEAAVRFAVWEALKGAPIHEALREDYEAKVVRFKEHLSPFTVKQVGAMPEEGWPLFIAMHGGGGAPQRVNDRQWAIMQNYYRDQDSVPGYLYAALRAPNNTWNGFYDDYVYPLIENLIHEFVYFWEVDPNKVFLMGYSHGGYGAFAIGPKMPDYFAAIHSSAAAPTDGETSAKTLRNTIFTYMIGENDHAYGRVERCQRFNETIQALRGDRTDIYPVTMEYKEGYGHGGLPDKDKIAGMYPARRNPVPRELAWELTDSVITHFFWLHVPEPGKGQELNAACRENKITVTSKNISAAELFLDSRLADFSKPVTLRVNGKQTSHQLAPSLAVLCETMLERGDPDLAFTARLPLAL